MSNVEVFIDLSDADIDLNAEELEKLTNSFKQEIKEIVEDVESVRKSEIPDRGKGLAAFVPGLLKTVVQSNALKIKELVVTLGKRFSARVLKLEYETDGTKSKFVIDYTNQEELDRAIHAIEKLSQVKISVTKLDN